MSQLFKAKNVNTVDMNWEITKKLSWKKEKKRRGKEIKESRKGIIFLRKASSVNV